MQVPHQRRRSAARGNDGWTAKEVRDLGMTTDIETAASIFGIGRTLAYDLVRTGRFPVQPLRLGRRLLIPVAGILAVLDAPPIEGRPGEVPPTPQP